MRLSELFGRHPVELSSKDSCAQPYVDVAAVRICYRSGWRGPQRERGIPELAAIVHLGIGGFFVLHSPNASRDRDPADRSSRAATPDLMPVPRRIRRLNHCTVGALASPPQRRACASRPLCSTTRPTSFAPACDVT